MIKKPFLSALLRAMATILFLALAGSWAGPRALAQANASPPERLTYQGFLTDAGGNPLGNTNTGPKNYDVIFRIFDAQTGGVSLWAEQQTVTVDKGYFSVLLGEVTAGGSEPHPALSTLFTNATASDRYVEMTVKGIGAGAPPADVTILPRLRLLTSPYAFLAASANRLVSSSGGDLITGGALGAVTIAGTLIAPTVSATTVNATTLAGAHTGNGFGLNNLDASKIASGTLPDGRLSGTYASPLTLPNPANILAGNGAALTGLNGANINAGSIDLGKLVAAVQQALCPAGTILAYAGDTAPAGWALCDGATVNPATQPALFAVVGYRFGGSTAGGIHFFNLPDFRGRFLRGRDFGQGRDPDRADRGAMAAEGATGDAVGSIQAGQIQAHTHTYIHEYATSGNDGSSDPYERYGFDTETTGSTGGNETRPLNAYVNYIIKY